MNEHLLKKLAKPLIVIATLIWGSTFFIMKDTLDSVDLQFLLAFRFTFAAVILAVVFWKHWKGMDRSCWWRGAVMGLLLYAAYTVQNYGLMGTTPGKNAFFTAVYCVMVPFLYWVVDRLRPDRFNVLAALLCIAGIGFVSWDGGFSLGYGDVLTLISGFLYACHITATAKFSQGRDIFLLTVIQFATTAVCCWAGTCVTGGFPAGGLPAKAWLVLVYLAVAPPRWPCCSRTWARSTPPPPPPPCCSVWRLPSAWPFRWSLPTSLPPPSCTSGSSSFLWRCSARRPSSPSCAKKSLNKRRVCLRHTRLFTTKGAGRAAAAPPRPAAKSARRTPGRR